jgi:DNA-binding transcriptional LysR family regulator
MKDRELAERARALGLRDQVLELELLRVFLCVAQFGSFSSAARSLDRTQAAVSLQIKRLEEAAGVALLVRNQRGVSMTEAGSALHGYARDLLEMHARALAAIRADGLGGRVRIGAIDHYAINVLPGLIATFQAEHPDVRIEVETGVAPAARARLGQDLDLLISLHRTGTGRGTVLQTQEVSWAVARDSVAFRRSPLPVALGLEGGLLRQMAIEDLHSRPAPWRLAFQSGNTAVLEAAVAAGLAVGVFRLQTIGPHLRALTAADGFGALASVDLVLEIAPGAQPRQVLAFRELLLAGAGL